MVRLLLLLNLTLLPLLARAIEADPLVGPSHLVQPDDPAWRDLLAQVEHRPDGIADFEERRWFPFRKLPAILKGEVRVSTARGLSLHYLDPLEQIVIVDERGLLLREGPRETAPPADPRGTAANTALLHLLRFDLRALGESFEVYGERVESRWTLALVPRADALRRTLGQITVTGDKASVRRIEMRRSASQRVEILVEPPREPANFTAEELRRFFR